MTRARSNRHTAAGTGPAEEPAARGRGRMRAVPKVSRRRKPEGMSLEAWQTELRRQFGREQRFVAANAGDDPVFSEFHVTNPQSGHTYRVAIRGLEPGGNFCGCPDFATNTLGTCKHIEFLLARLGRNRRNREALAAGFHPSYSSVYLKYGARREVHFRPGRACPPALARLAAGYFGGDRVLRPESFATFDAFLAKAARIPHDLRCYEDALGFVAEVRDLRQRGERLDRAFPGGAQSGAFADLLRVPLYDYQRQGALFAARAGRALIGDEMGLGKTIEAIAAVEIMARQLGAERTLVICPTSLKHQWEREIARCVDRSVEVIAGLRGRRAQRWATATFYKITNYDTVHLDLDRIRAWSPDIVILDEAQRIKNWSTRTARTVKQLASPYAIVLTGTPIENRLEELLSIVQFIDQHRLGPTFRFLHDHQVVEPETGRVVGYKNLGRIAQTLAPILIRRRKAEVLPQLPARLEKRFFVPITLEQQKLHEENRELVARIAAKWRRYGFLSEVDQRRLTIALQNMRMVCDSTYLLDQRSESGAKADEVTTLLGELLEDPATKIVVFSQWVRMHELLARRLAARGWDHVLFHGGVDGQARKHLVDRFREDPRCRVFLSTDAGGVGLNLQHASVVLNVDLPWNPAVLEQRIGRVHRLGQSRPVQVVHFIAQGTIEEGMLSVLGFKKSLFAGVLDGGEAEVFLGGSRLKRFIESVEQATGRIPEAVAEEAPVPEPPGPASADADSDSEATAASPDPWTDLLQTGVLWLARLAGDARAATAEPPVGSGNRAERALPRLLEAVRDEATGERYLRVRMPPREVVEQAVDAFRALLEGLRR